MGWEWGEGSGKRLKGARGPVGVPLDPTDSSPGPTKAKHYAAHVWFTACPFCLRKAGVYEEMCVNRLEALRVCVCMCM